MAKLLRGAGAVVLIAAAAGFLLNDWQGFSSVERCFAFLAFTLVVAGAGFAAGLWLEDAKNGPPATTRGGRFGLVPVMAAHFARPGTIVLDDANRLPESEIVLKWQQLLEARVTRSTEGAGTAILHLPG